MAAFTRRSAVTAAVLAALNDRFDGTAVTVHEDKAGDAPCVVLHDVTNRLHDGPQSDPHARAVIVYQLNSIHTAPDRATQVRDAVADRMLNAPIGAVGVVITFVEPQPSIGVMRDDSTASAPLYLSRDRYAVHAQQVPVS